MPEQLNVDQLVSRQESSSTLVRFEDETDANAPRLNYAVPLPGSFLGKLFVETDFLNDQLPWTDAAREDQRLSVVINEFTARMARGETPPLPPIANIAVVPGADAPRRVQEPFGFVERNFTTERQPSGDVVSPERFAITSLNALDAGANQPIMTRLALRFENLEVGFDQIAAEAREGRAPVFYRSFGGAPKLAFVQEAGSPSDANPRFVIIEHYRLSSFFGDYGAGKTVGVFSLMPGEETTIYVRNWRSSTTTMKQASSIFDSHTEEAAAEFETDLLTETTDTASKADSATFNAKYAHSGGVNIGLIKASHEMAFSGEKAMQSARQTASKNVAKVTTNHASKASSKREIQVTQEIGQTEAQEFETITERKIRNANLSRTLNIVARELNQEFTTYFSLVDVTLAFVNDLNVFEMFQVHEIDRMLSKYLPEPLEGPGVALPGEPTPFGNVSPYSFVRQRLIDQINSVYDFRGTRHDFLEEVALTDDGEQVFRVDEAPADAATYLRVRRPRGRDEPNPFYEPGFVPVEGIVMNESRNTVRTPAVIVDALLGHGVALDNYALGMQQEALRKEQNENRKMELALDLIQNGAPEQLEGYRSIFGSVDAELLREVALREE